MSSAKWLYRAVVIVCRCPSSLPITVSPTPEPAPIEAKLCLRSCNRTPPSCACLVMARQGRCKSWRGVSLLTPGKAASPSRGSAVNTASAGAPSKTWRRPVLASTNSRRPFGISTSRHRRCKTSRSRRPVKSSNRIAAVTIGLITVQRFFFGTCFAFLPSSSTHHGNPTVSARRRVSPRRAISSADRNRSRPVSRNGVTSAVGLKPRGTSPAFPAHEYSPESSVSTRFAVTGASLPILRCSAQDDVSPIAPTCCARWSSDLSAEGGS